MNNFSQASYAIDCRMVDDSGIGTIIQNTVPGLLSRFPESQFYLLFNPQAPLSKKWLAFSNAHPIEIQSTKFTLREQWELIKKIPTNVSTFWSPHFNAPFFWKKNLLMTLCDVNPLAHPELSGNWIKRISFKVYFWLIKKGKFPIVTISHFSKEEILKYLKIDANRVSVAWCGVNPLWFEKTEGKTKRSKPYILYVGNVKPHKNLKNLIAAFDIIKNEISHDLVIVGKKEGFITGDESMISKALERQKDRVVFTGKVSFEDLKIYYQNASLFVFPSLYEGFGLPPLEAMASGVPVIVSNRASIPEICENAAIYFDPESPRDIADCIRQVLGDITLRSNLISKGLERSRTFTWEPMINRLVQEFKAFN